MGCVKSSLISDNRPQSESSDQGRFRAKYVPRGSLVNVYKQDPTVKSIGYRQMWAAIDLKPGPATQDIVTAGINTIVMPSDGDNNFLFNPSTQPQEFDAVNTLAIVNYILEMYRRALKRMNYKKTLQWQWGEEPLRVYPLAGEQANAYYSRQNKALLFYYFRHPNTNKFVYTSRSFDVIAHEAGHAILDSLRPKYTESRIPQTMALHESFGDITAIFGLLEQLDMCEAIIVQSKGNLHEKSFFASFAEEFGDGLGRAYGLRNADVNKTIDEVTNEVHDLSRVFTGAIYDIITDVYELTRDLEKYDPAESLYRVGKHFIAVIVLAFLRAPEYNAEFLDIVDAMVDVEPEDEYKSLIISHFEKRKIYHGSEAMPMASENSPFVGACGTIQMKFNFELRDILNATCRPNICHTQDNVIQSERL